MTLSKKKRGETRAQIATGFSFSSAPLVCPQAALKFWDICSNPGDGTAARLSAPGAVRHDVAHQVTHVVLQVSDDVLDDVSDRDHAYDLARVQHR
jgi:hypothetical protein